MFNAPAELFQHRLHPGQIGSIAADKGQQLTVPRRAGGAADGTVDQRCPFGTYTFSKGALGFRANGAHFDKQLALDLPREQAVGTVKRGGNGLGVGQDRQNDVSSRCQLGGGIDDFGAMNGQGFGLGRGAVPDRDLVAVFEQPFRDGRAHSADTCYADFHALAPVVCEACMLTKARPPGQPFRCWFEAIGRGGCFCYNSRLSTRP